MKTQIIERPVKMTKELKEFCISAEKTNLLIFELEKTHKFKRQEVVLGVLSASVGFLYYACKKDFANKQLEKIRLNAIELVKEYENQKKGTTQ
jgi:hypothetical protein